METCEHCGANVETEEQLEIEHRGCRLKAAFPAAYTEQGDGLVTFDMQKVATTLGLFRDIVVGRNGQDLHPIDGNLHFRISADYKRPEIWIQIPLTVGNCLSSISYRITETDWIGLVARVNAGLQEARAHIAQRE